MTLRIIGCMLMLQACATPATVNSFYIDTSCNLSIVEGELNGRKTFFLLDTGAGLTTMDLNQSKQFGFSSAETDEMVGGFTNDRTHAKMAIGIQSIKIYGLEIHDGVVYTNRMDNLVEFISGCSHKTISGIIGAPLIKKYGLVIDLMNSKLIRVN
jgi:hypothetical protein